MPTGAKVLLFFLFIPFLAGIGHDVYLNYFSDDEKIKTVKRLQIDPEAFLPSDLGWIWEEYHISSMDLARTMVEPEIWKEQVDPILQLPTMVVGAVPLALGIVFLLISFILGVWPFSRYGKLRKQKDDDFAVYKSAKESSYKYNKK